MKEISSKMKIANFYFKLLLKIILFFFSLMLIMLSSNWFMLFILLEFNLFLLIWVILKSLSVEKMSFLMKYFLIQSLNSLLLIFFWVIMDSEFKLTMVLMFMIIKMALPPFHYWLKDLVKFMSLNLLMLILVFQKLPIFMVFLIFFSFSKNFMLSLLVLSSVWGVVSFYNQNSFGVLFFFSSIIQSVFFLLMIITSKKSFLLFFLFYCVMIVMMFLLMKAKMSISKSMEMSILMIFLLGFLLGIPPSPIFFMKYFFMVNFSPMGSGLMIGLVVFVILTSQIIYFLWGLMNLESMKSYLFFSSNKLYKLTGLSIMLSSLAFGFLFLI